MVLRVLTGLLLALVGALAIGWMSPVHPLLEAVTNVRAQLFPLALVAVIGFVVMRRWRRATASAAVLAVCLSFVVPYWTASVDALPTDGETARIMQYNIFFGNEDASAIAAHVNETNSTVVVLHEVTPQQWGELAPLLTEHPHHIAAPLDESQGQLGGGMVMVSREPLERIDVASTYSPGDRVVIAAVTDVLDEQIMVIGLHPFASRNESRKADLRQAQLDGVAELASSATVPVVIVADLNVTPTSPQYGGFIDDLGWRDPHRIVGWKSTWPTWGGPFGIPIDHVFVSNDVALHGYELGDGAGSDHLSLVAEISFVTDATG